MALRLVSVFVPEGPECFLNGGRVEFEALGVEGSRSC